MKFKKKELLLGVLLGSGLNLLSNLRDRLPEELGRHQGQSQGEVRNRVPSPGPRRQRTSRQEESQIFGKVGVLLIGVGVGVGVGLLIAPASGEKTRADITDKVTDLGDKVREQARRKPPSATGTHGE